jgi:hypothetical protein
MSNYDHVAAIYEFAKEHGYKVQDFNTMERRNQRGRYNYVKVAFVVPVNEPRKLETMIAEIEAAVDENSAEAQKDEVINNEI